MLSSDSQTETSMNGLSWAYADEFKPEMLVSLLDVITETAFPEVRPGWHRIPHGTQE